MKKPIAKFLSILFVTGLLSACNNTFSKVSNKSDSTESPISYTSRETQSSSKKEENSSSKSSVSIAPSSKTSVTPPSSSVEHNPNNCDNHVLEEEILVKASLLEKGIKHYHCPNCGADFNDYYYDLDEFVFSDTTYMYDENEHEILIDGVLPYGVSVRYENTFPSSATTARKKSISTGSATIATTAAAAADMPTPKLGMMSPKFLIWWTIRASSSLPMTMRNPSA